MNELDTRDLFKMIYSNRVSLFVIVLCSAVATVIFTSGAFIAPLYKSSIVLYPTTSFSISNELMNNNKMQNIDHLEIGDEEQTDKMTQILKSDDIKAKIIEKYDLLNHYALANCEQKYSEMNSLFQKRFKISKTEFNAVRIDVIDTDPELAAAMANDMAVIFDETVSKMQSEMAKASFDIIQRHYDEIVAKLNALEDSLQMINRNGESTENMNKTRRLEREIECQFSYLTTLKPKYEKMRIDAMSTIPHKFVISSATVSDRPCHPQRLIITLLSVISVTFLSVIVIAVFEKK